MTSALGRGMSIGLVAVVVFLQASSCCCCLGGAIAPTMAPAPVSKELAQQMRQRVNETKAQGGTVTVEISDQELTSYVVMLLQSGAGEFPARDTQIQFGDGYVDIWATFIDIAPTEIPVYVRATVDAVDGQLVLDLTRVNAGAIPVPGAMREMIAQILSESLAELGLGFEIHHVEVTPGRMALTGQVTGDIPDLPERW